MQYLQLIVKHGSGDVFICMYMWEGVENFMIIL